jgi:CDI immunity proteins
VNRNKSIEELENDYWLEPEFNSNLVLECHRLRKLPISKLTTENLRILIGQKIGLPFIVPVALEILSVDPLASGKMYKGDLLANILAIPKEFWVKNPELNNHLVEIANEVTLLAETINTELLPVLSGFQFK